MTIEIGNQKVGRFGRTRPRADSRAAATLLIGEPGARIFECPACSRPLNVGTRRCPDCDTRLIAGVTASRVASLVGAALFVGAIVIGGLAAVASAAP